MYRFGANLLYNFFIAFGVMVGASVFAGMAAVINNHPPIKTMINVAGSIKIWAVAVALGGTFSSFQVIEKGILTGEIRSVIKQVAYIMIALAGANIGYGFVRIIERCSKLWME